MKNFMRGGRCIFPRLCVQIFPLALDVVYSEATTFQIYAVCTESWSADTSLQTSTSGKVTDFVRSVLGVLSLAGIYVMGPEP